MESTKVAFTNHVRGEVQKLAVFHTEVDPEFKGRGFAKLLLDELVRYAREKELKIIPLCPYVNAQFQRHPEEYGDVWSKDWHQ